MSHVISAITSRRPRTAALAALLGVAACSRGETGSEATSREALRVDSLSLEELAPVVLATPLREDSSQLIAQLRAQRYLATGELIVADIAMREVKRYDRDGAFAGLIGRPGGGPREYQAPWDIAATPDGDSVFVLDAGGERIVAFPMAGDSGGWTLPLTTQLRPTGLYHTPHGLAITGSNVDLRDPAAGNLAFHGPDSTLRYELPGPAEFVNNGPAVSFGSYVLSGTGPLIVAIHPLSHRVLVLDSPTFSARDTLTLPAAYMAPQELSPVPIRDERQMREKMRTMTFMAAAQVMTGTTVVLATSRFSAEHEQYRSHLALLDLTTRTLTVAREGCTCRLAGAHGDTLVTLGGGAETGYVLQKRVLRR